MEENTFCLGCDEFGLLGRQIADIYQPATNVVLLLAGSFLFAPVNLKERILKYEGPLLFEEVRFSKV